MISSTEVCLALTLAKEVSKATLQDMLRAVFNWMEVYYVMARKKSPPVPPNADAARKLSG